MSGPVEPRLGSALAAARFKLAAWRLQDALKAGFRPDQPRVPAGSPDGGQWVDEDSDIVLVQSRPRGSAGGGPRRIGGTWRDLTPEQATRLEISQSQMHAAVRRVRKVEPHWSPRPSFHTTVEGEIRANNAATREAETQYRVLQQMGCVPGPYAAGSLPARGPGRNFTAAERAEGNRLGKKFGCHTCGRKDAEFYVLDHQLPNRLNLQGLAQSLFPQCSHCSARQGGYVMHLRRRIDRERHN